MSETGDEEKAILDAALRRLEDPEWQRRWRDGLPSHLEAAQAAWDALSPAEREALWREMAACW